MLTGPNKPEIKESPVAHFLGKVCHNCCVKARGKDIFKKIVICLDFV